MRRTIQSQAAARSPLATLLLGVLERFARWPVVGPTCLRWSGFIHANQGRHTQAVEAYQAALDGGLTQHPSLRYDLGQSLLETGDDRRAEAEFRRVMDLVPHEFWPVYGFVQCLLRKGCEAEVVPHLLAAARTLPAEQAVNLPFPESSAALVVHDDEQVAALREFVRDVPDAAAASILLARVETLRGNGAEASALFRSAARVRFRGREDASAHASAPTFIIIGQAKAGTSALFHYLSSHPSIVPPLVKEPHYWSIHHHLGPTWYESLFPRLPEGSGLITGEGSVTSLTVPETPARVRTGLPDAKLILLLREPVSRAYSEYWMHVRRREQLASFGEVMARELERSPRCPVEDGSSGVGPLPDGYLTRSAALPHLKRWLAHFPAEQMLILRHEQMAADLPATMQRVCRFLGVAPFVPHDRRRHNEGSYPPICPDLERRLREWFAPHERALEDFLAELPKAP